MIFPTIDFAVFFAVVFGVSWLLLRRPRAWKIFILLASYFFYGYWDWRFIGLIAGASVVNHLAAVGMHRSRNPHVRRTLLVLACVFNLGSIGFFKYARFLAEQAMLLCHLLGLPLDFWLPVLDYLGQVILPVGISFFTFQALSYVIDVYRRVMEPADSLLDFACYLAFFPQLVAGPIVRAVDLLPQVSRPQWPAAIDLSRAGSLILGGLFKKIVIANFLAAAIVDPVFARPDAYGAWDTLWAVYGYAIQIYCDFSAYSDIAIGLCLLLGFKIPLNFDAPYLAGSIQDFWRRWHISLSSFLRDYLYIPMGGSRGRSGRTYRNLLVTFLLGGLWHGAGWTFIAWGALHGIYLSLERALGWGQDRPDAAWGGRILRRVVVWHLVCLSWLFFRGQSFGHALDMLRALGQWSAPVQRATPLVLVIAAIGYLSQLLDGERAARLWQAVSRLPAWAQGALAAVGLTIILGLGPKGVAAFIYFQF
ncbi:MAG: MBOAT family protein [Candidatus Marinimicrobia bacterium]|nr:MBOAT family protein [Candidatus Neomarinimicrobiota bacterium]